MKVKFSRPWAYAHGGHRVEQFQAGQEYELEEAVAKQAAEDGALEDSKKKPEANKSRGAAPQNKALGGAPEVKDPENG